MSSNVTHAKEPLFRMVKRDAIPQKKAWMIRAAAFLLSLATGAVVIMMLGHNPFSVYISMIKGAWGTKTVSYETIKIAIPLLITAIGISFAFKMKFWNIGAEGQILVGAVAAGAFGLFTAHIFPKNSLHYHEGLPELRNMHIIGIISYKIQKERWHYEKDKQCSRKMDLCDTRSCYDSHHMCGARKGGDRI